MVYFKVEVWGFDVLTVVGIMFTNNRCGNFLLQKHICYFYELRVSGHFNVRGKKIILFQRLKIFSVFKEEKHVIV